MQSTLLLFAWSYASDRYEGFLSHEPSKVSQRQTFVISIRFEQVLKVSDWLNALRDSTIEEKSQDGAPLELT